MAPFELLRRYPGAEQIARVELADLPTPVERLDQLGAEIGNATLWVKRDDLTAELYGGNKVRKLEFLLADAQSQGYDRVWTVGAIGSHHVLATSLFAQRLEMIPHALHFPQPVTEHVLDVLRALSTARPRLELVDSKHTLPFEMAKERVSQWLSDVDDPYYIPGGGSAPRGVLGYVNAALELARQIDNGELPTPEAIFVAAGTCGTLAGLTLGCRLAELPTDIIGVRVVDKVMVNSVVASTLANRTGRLLGQFGIDAPRIRPGDIQIVDDQFGDGYGEPTPAGRRAIELADQFADLQLDPTYTAKTFAGLMDYDPPRNRPLHNVLYWHTLSSADLSSLIESADPASDLPAEYQQFFEHTP